MLNEARSGSHKSNPPTTASSDTLIFVLFSNNKITHQASEVGPVEDKKKHIQMDIRWIRIIRCNARYTIKAIYQNQRKIRLQEKFDLL